MSSKFVLEQVLISIQKSDGIHNNYRKSLEVFETAQGELNRLISKTYIYTIGSRDILFSVDGHMVTSRETFSGKIEFLEK